MQNLDSSYYQYMPLGPRQFRVLKLRLAKNQFSTIRGELHVIDIDGASPFDALSYTWGHSTLEEEDDFDAQVFTRVPRCYPIIVNDRIVLVTKSLRDALRLCRRARLPAEQRYLAETGVPIMQEYLFADAACINQQDLAERSQQVRIMCDIYRSAQTVRAWLGNEQSGDAEGLRAALKLYKYFPDIDTENPTREELSKLSLASIPGVLTAKEWCAWAVLLSREWFWRSWVVQEIALNHKTQVYCGAKSVDWRILSDGLRLVQRGAWGVSLIGLLSTNPEHKPPKRYLEKIAPWLGAGHPLTWIRVYQDMVNRDERTSMSLLTSNLYQGTRCSDPRDKVYSTMGMVSEFRNVDDHQFSVDYTEPTAATFIRATHHVLRISCSLDILTNAENVQGKRTDLPSWCPDYDAKPWQSPSHFTGADRDRVLPWKASGHSKHNAALGMQLGHTITVRGHCIDSILHTNEASGHNPLSIANSTNLLSFMKTMLSTSNYVESIVEGLWRTMLIRVETGSSVYQPTKQIFKDAWSVSLHREIWYTDRHSGEAAINRTASDLDGLFGILEQVTSSCHAIHTIVPSITLLQQAWLAWKNLRPPSEAGLAMSYQQIFVASGNVQTAQDVIQYASDVQKLFNKSISYHVSRKILSTAKGSIGLASERVQFGDEVWLFAGARVPYIVRRQVDGTTTFICTAYIDGVMKGEEWPPEETELESLVLT